MARYIAQVFVLGAQVIARAFSRALEQEIAASRAAAQRSGSKNTKATAYTSAKLGMTVPEAKQILNVDSLDPAEIEKKYNHLFEVNDRSRGGSFYLQSKVVRAKERLEEEIKLKNEETANGSQKKDEMS